MNKSIQKMFEPLAGRYELVNHVITFGLDMRWRKKAAGIAARVAGEGRDCVQGGGASEPCCATAPGVSPGGRVWLDVSTGTGEMADLISRQAGSGTTVLAADFSRPMLRGAISKRTARRTAVQGLSTPRETIGSGRMLLIAADDRQLPVRDASLALVTISLGTRNLNTSRDALVSCFKEFHRVLRPGGRFVNLETSQPRSRAVRTLFHAYVGGFLKPVASALSGNRSAYSYLASSMRGFYGAENLTEIIREAGFARVEVKRLFLGVAAIHVAEK